jgi:hypothetical protein
VRNVTGCPYMGTSHSEIFDVYPYAEALTRYFLRHKLAAVLPRKFKIAFEGCTEDHALGVDQRHRLARQDPGRAARLPRDHRRRHVDHAGDRLRALRVPAVEEMQNVAEACCVSSTSTATTSTGSGTA